MARKRSGRLVAVEGTRGQDVTDWSKRVCERFGGSSNTIVSRWNASESFKRLRPDRYLGPGPGARTLVLLYAADLAYRCKREILPALRAGRTVVAAPYLHTITGFALAMGLSEQWLRELFRFAPPASLCYRVKEKQKSSGWTAGGRPGFLEMYDRLLAHGNVVVWHPRPIRLATIAYLDQLEEEGVCARLTKKAR